MVDYIPAKEANIRLIILRALADDPDGTLNTHMLQMELERFVYQRSRNYIANQLKWLERETGAVRVVEAGSEVIGQLTETGRDHLAHRITLHGVQRPSKALEL